MPDRRSDANSDLSTGAWWMLSACFVLSGVSALIYQTAWMRQFALVFGTSELAVATVLAAYMAGLGLGAFLIERYLPRIARPIPVYATFELCIALAAVALIPAALTASQWLLERWFGGQSEPAASVWGTSTLYYLVSAFLILLLPTALMGATLPLLVRQAVTHPAQIGRRIGLLYASNTAGAVIGALLSSLVLLPRLGLRQTLWCAAGLNLLVAALALPLRKHSAPQWPATTPQAGRWRWAPGPHWVLPLLLLSGTVSFLHEVLWTRMLSHVIGSSLYAFGTMLASFLGGIAIGGAAGALLARSRTAAVRALAIVELLIAASAVLAWWLLQHTLPHDRALVHRIEFGILILAPLALTIGASYPLAVRVLSDGPSDAALASARVYSWNTVGAIAGALLGGFVLMPMMRYEGTILLAVAASCVLAIATMALLERTNWRFALAVTAPAAVLLLLFRPEQPEELLRSSSLTGYAPGALLYYAVGRSATVTVLDQDDMLMLRTNGLPESAMARRGALPRFNGELWMPPLAVLSRPDSAHLLIIGYGAGRMVEAVPPSVQTIDVLELEPRVIEANRALHTQRSSDPLLDSRVNVILNDARGALALTTRRYDAIISQPSHPWTAGASHLYTREFMQQARAHLTDDGVFLQWMNTDFLDEKLLRSFLATLADVFPHLRVYRPDYNTLVFLASNAPLDAERSPEQLRRILDQAPRHYARLGIAEPEDLIAALALDDAGAAHIAQGAAPITDDRNPLATSLIYETHGALDATAIGELLAPYDPLRDGRSFIYQQLQGQLDFEYLARRLNTRIDRSAGERIEAIAGALGDTATAAYLHAIAATARGVSDAGVQQLLGAELQRYPTDDALRFEYIHPEFGALAFGNAAPDVLAAARPLGAVPTQIIAAAQAAAHQQWDKVADADAALAQVPLNAPWSAEATQLRVEWRIRVMNENLRERLCGEALSLIDETALIQQATPLRALRAWVGVGLHRADISVESISSFARNIADRGTSLSNAERQTLRGLVPALRQLLNGLENSTDIEHARWQAVSSELDRAQAIVQTS